MNKNILKNRKAILSAALVIAATRSPAFAQGNGIAGNQRSHLYGEFLFSTPGTKLIYAIGAVVGLIGGVKVYGKFSSGDPRHQQDSRLVVRRVHLPDCCAATILALILPLINNVMAEYPINKGIGRPVEFKGLKAQYLFIFCEVCWLSSSCSSSSTWSVSTSGYVSASARHRPPSLYGRPSR